LGFIPVERSFYLSLDSKAMLTISRVSCGQKSEEEFCLEEKDARFVAIQSIYKFITPGIPS
jgi:hypothetical protein